MNDKQKKLIMEYCGWCLHDFMNQDDKGFYIPVCKKCGYSDKFIDHLLDGNDIFEAVKIMEEKKEFFDFESFARCQHGLDYMEDIYSVSLSFFIYLLQNFFELMAKWLEVKK